MSQFPDGVLTGKLLDSYSVDRRPQCNPKTKIANLKLPFASKYCLVDFVSAGVYQPQTSGQT